MAVLAASLNRLDSHILALEVVLPSKRIVMVVEDDPDVREVTQMLLEDSFHVETVPAGTGIQALRLLEEKTANLILLDIMMPGMSGLEVTARLKANTATRHIPIVALTAGADRANVLKAGCDDFIQKPYEMDTFLSVVRQHLDRQYQSAR